MKHILIIGTVLVLLSTTACFNFDNPVDPEATSYQGYPTVLSVDEVTPVYPSNNGNGWRTFLYARCLSATGYEVQISDSPNKNPDGSFPTPVDTITIDDGAIFKCRSGAALTTDGTYYWQVRASDTGGWGKWSSVYTFHRPRVLWSAATSSGMNWESPALGLDGTVYITTHDSHYLYAFNPDNGSLKWKFDFSFLCNGSPAVGPDGTIYVTGNWDYLNAVNPNGSLKWKYKDSDVQKINLTPAIKADGSITMLNDLGELTTVNPNGTLNHAITGSDSFQTDPVVGADGSEYYGDNTSFFHRNDPNDPLKNWDKDTDSATRQSPAIGSDGAIYIVKNFGNVWALNAAGDMNWSNTSGAAISSPVLSASNVYFGSSSGKIYQIQQSNGLNVSGWPVTIPGASDFRSTPAIGNDNCLYIGNDNGNFYCINGSTGATDWICNLSSPIGFSSPVINEDGIIFIQTENGMLFALNSDCTGLAAVQWPMYHHDPQHTGRQHLP